MPDTTTALDHAPASEAPPDFSPRLAALARQLRTAPGVTADHLLTEADHADKAAREIALRDGAAHAAAAVEAVCADLHAYAAHLRELAPRYPTPPREPAAP